MSLDSNNSHNHDNSKKEISYDPSSFLSFQEIKQLDEQYVLSTYARMPVSFRYGAGEVLYDTESNEYIDFLSGIAVTSLGHSHSDLIETLSKQAELLWHTSNIFYSQQQVMLARALIDLAFPKIGGKAFFCNSGTEANEAAFKFMRAYGESKNKNHIVALDNGFHGRTMGALSLTGQDKIRNGFGNVLEPITFVTPNDKNELIAAVTDKTCGIILEPIQGEGGVLPLTQDFVQTARELATTYNSLLVFDEVQTGIGRTGSWFAYQQYLDCTPDVITLAKALGSGFPIGAMLVNDKYKNIFKVGSHGSTFGGNHLATAIGYETLRIMEASNVLENVKTMSFYLKKCLNTLKDKYPQKIIEIRGVGLIIGIVLHESIQARPVMEKALSKHLIIGRAGDNVLRLLPPLNVRKYIIDAAIEKLDSIISEI